MMEPASSSKAGLGDLVQQSNASGQAQPHQVGDDP